MVSDGRGKEGGSSQWWCKNEEDCRRDRRREVGSDVTSGCEIIKKGRGEEEDIEEVEWDAMVSDKREEGSGSKQ